MRKEYTDAFAPRRREVEGGLVRHDGVRILTWERTYRLLTPLFGGGVEPRHADPLTAVRASEVRGQLRFWWRAVRGWQAQGSLKRLLALESRLFGSAGEGGASPLLVEVEPLEKGKEAHPFEDQPGRGFPRARRDVAHPYLAFPLQRTKQDSKNYPVRRGVRFRLRLRFPERVGDLDVKEELEAALWAWETFGGIGARTRRGFGALMREGSRPLGEAEIREKLRAYAREAGWPEGVPHLTPASLVRVVPLSWREVAEAYQAFRQSRREGQGRNRPGRSHWPEPDEVRRRTEQYAFHHKPQHPVRKFPRAQFGLPIIFHFKDREVHPDATLKPQAADRLASPLIFRPLAEKACVVAVLEAPRTPPGGVVLEWKGRECGVETRLSPEEAEKIEPLRARGGEPDPLRAFVMHLEARR
ncbi:type III-B CRISPR module RAMP protein Cmr1 [Marinithermus hydrothermalis]|uniref:CRISPR-associated protein TM1795 family protein n=1 Tax=Marinithermus hydrothermalis (strain DSM 14884 / JCM 11576 / T1) TaxID=869210 RepID=F2NKH9_MARHT|nr:type III-B CRISPR module RAMP protein Cmr1 [Marinithermus hydrothermalis]AEB12639.1 CRISPR-associated protein TM1795 family protein [Marinithermus hydrothermalis DSM 14884]